MKPGGRLLRNADFDEGEKVRRRKVQPIARHTTVLIVSSHACSTQPWMKAHCL